MAEADRGEHADMPSSLVGVNTLVPNRLVHGGAVSGTIPELAGYDHARREVPYGRNSRIDLLLERGPDRCYVEVKNCSLLLRPTGSIRTTGRNFDASGP